MAFTDEQQLAIDTHGMNIIVSAGAGSGKTAVLTERIFKMLEAGQDVSRLLVLTFTKAAALEMKTRVKNRLIQSHILEDQLAKVDSSYITTFDSFSLSVVRKYHYLLNLSKDVSIIDSGVISLYKKEVLDSIFNDYYVHQTLEENQPFFDLLGKFTKKNDDSFRNFIFNIAEGIEKKADKDKYLAIYIDKHFEKSFLQSKVDEYVTETNHQLQKLLPLINDLYTQTSDTKYGDALYSLIDYLNIRHDYSDLKAFFSTLKFPQLRGADDETKALKEAFTKKLNNFVNVYLAYSDTQEIYHSLLETQKYVKVIIDILTKYFRLLTDYKRQNNLFEFNDIALMSLELVNDFPEVKEELRKSFDEILIDEYQDTSDIQESFIQAIACNNVYMVGDIKQSIYRFRNANPYIFKEKYHLYRASQGGFKIDLSKNFRSRSEVIGWLNRCFSLVMTEDFGDANYLLDHQMQYGNLAYDNNYVPGFNYETECLMYDKSDKEYSNSEIEAFIIADKIKELMNSKMQVYDKDNKSMRLIEYKDIAIILDRGKDYELIRKIFTSEGIPLDVIANEKISNHELLHIFNSLFNLIKLVNTADKLYPFYFLSVARSFLFEESDNWLLSQSFQNYQGNEIYDKALKVKEFALNNAASEVFEVLLEEFQVYEKLIKIGDIEDDLMVIAYVADLIADLGNIGYSFFDVADYFATAINDDIQLSKTSESSGNGVQLLNIHQSKGLEYPICFFAGLTNKFNLQDLNDSFLFNEKFGIVTPYFTDRPKDTIDKVLLKKEYIKAEISERIRLFYVAISRSREKIYFTFPNVSTYKEQNYLDDFRSIMDFVVYYFDEVFRPYTKQVDYQPLVNKNYLDVTVSDYAKHLVKTQPMTFNDKAFVATVREKGQISKELLQIKDDKTSELLKVGTHLHAILETIDLTKKDLSNITLSVSESQILKKVLELPCFKHLDNAQIYQELEFIFSDETKEYHGIIDLLVEYPDHFEIIDYKLYNTDKTEYLRQMSVYYKYVTSISQKPVKMYLLSLIKADLQEVEYEGD